MSADRIERNKAARLCRKLQRETHHLRLRTCPWGSRWINDLGRYYIVDVSLNYPTATDIDLDAWLAAGSGR